MDLKEERAVLLEAWRVTESEASEGGDVSVVDSRWPRKLKMRRDTGVAGTMMKISPICFIYFKSFCCLSFVGVPEEYYDYIFPDDEKPAGTKNVAIKYEIISYISDLIESIL